MFEQDDAGAGSACRRRNSPRPLHDKPQQHRTYIACIGPITAQTARECGLKVDIEAKTFTICGLVEAIVNFYQDLKDK